MLSEDQRPHVFAQKLDHIQCICKPWPIPREPAYVNTSFVSLSLLWIHQSSHNCIAILSISHLACPFRQECSRKDVLEHFDKGTKLSPLNEPLSNPISERLQPAKGGFPPLFLLDRPTAIFPGNCQFVGESVGHRNHLDQQEIEAGGIEECSVRVRGIVWRKRGLEGHWSYETYRRLSVTSKIWL